MATTEVISGEQRLLSRVLKKRAKGSLMEEQLSTEVNRRRSISGLASIGLLSFKFCDAMRTSGNH